MIRKVRAECNDTCTFVQCSLLRKYVRGVVHTLNWEIFATNNIRVFYELTSLMNLFCREYFCTRLKV